MFSVIVVVLQMKIWIGSGVILIDNYIRPYITLRYSHNIFTSFSIECYFERVNSTSRKFFHIKIMHRSLFLTNLLKMNLPFFWDSIGFGLWLRIGRIPILFIFYFLSTECHLHGSWGLCFLLSLSSLLDIVIENFREYIFILGIIGILHQNSEENSIHILRFSWTFSQEKRIFLRLQQSRKLVRSWPKHTKCWYWTSGMISALSFWKWR